VQPSTSQGRSAQPSPHAPGKRQQRGRTNAPRKQDRQEQLRKAPNGITAVAFLHRSVRSGHNTDSRRSEDGNRKG
jgi:hypothetical protein